MKKYRKYVPYKPLREKGRPREVLTGRLKHLRLKAKNNVFPNLDLYINIRWVKKYLTKKEFRYLEHYKHFHWTYKYARCKCPTCGTTHDDRTKFTTWASFWDLHQFFQHLENDNIRKYMRIERIRHMIPGEIENV